MAGTTTNIYQQAIPSARSSEQAQHPVIVILFVIATAQPFFFYLGPVLLTPHRAVLLVLFIPALIRWISGGAGGRFLPDYLMIGYTIWKMLSLAINDGTEHMFVYGGSQVLEVTGAYFVGRAYIRSRACFMLMVKAYLTIAMIVLPFMMLESVLGRPILLEIYRKLPGLRVFNSVNYEYRLGLRRAQGSFNHPIMSGVFASTSVSLALIALKASGAGLQKRVRMTMVSLGATFFSLSSGAFVSAGVQLGLFAWDTVLRNFKDRWRWFFTAGGVSYVGIALVADHSPIITIASKLAFSGATAWNRVQIWVYGSAEVMRHPILGMGHFSDWVRAPWMPLSIDNHWLLYTMRYGIPGIVMLLGAFFSMMYLISRRDYGPDLGLKAISRAATFSMAGVIVALSTVAAWDGPWSLILFVLGGAGFLLQKDLPLYKGLTRNPANLEGGAEDSSAQPPGRKIRYTRYDKGAPSRHPPRRQTR